MPALPLIGVQSGRTSAPISLHAVQTMRAHSDRTLTKGDLVMRQHFGLVTAAVTCAMLALPRFVLAQTLLQSLRRSQRPTKSSRASARWNTRMAHRALIGTRNIQLARQTGNCEPKISCSFRRGSRLRMIGAERHDARETIVNGRPECSRRAHVSGRRERALARSHDKDRRLHQVTHETWSRFDVAAQILRVSHDTVKTRMFYACQRARCQER